MRKRVLLLFFIPVGLIRAQSEAANLTGTVTDASGAVLPQVTVSLSSEGTGLTASSLTGESGRYFIPAVRPGAYIVSAARPDSESSSTRG